MNFLQRERWFLGFLGVMAGLLLLVWGWGTGRDSGWWAAWGQWVGGLGSIAAAWTAVWIAVEGWRRSDRQARQQARQFEEAQTRELATKFGVWIEERPISTEVTFGVTTMTRVVDTFVIMYHNSGAQPMYNVQVRVDIGADLPLIVRRRYLAPTMEPAQFDRDTSSFEKYIVRQLVKLNDPGFEEDKQGMDLARAVTADRADITVSFTDANGTRWTRAERGDLVRLVDEQ